MDKSQVINSIIDILLTNGMVKKDVVLTDNTSLPNECGIDSIKTIELVIHIEDKYGFQFDDEDLSLVGFETASSIADIVLNRLKPTE